MRTYGRVLSDPNNPASPLRWVKVETSADGANDFVWATTLIQCLKLERGESPFYANFGIPAQQSVVQQVFPDFYVSQTQAQFSGYFASLIVAKIQDRNPKYKINILTNAGVRLEDEVAV